MTLSSDLRLEGVMMTGMYSHLVYQRIPTASLALRSLPWQNVASIQHIRIYLPSLNVEEKDEEFSLETV